jgi:lysophospholipase L1-like esterase
MQIKCQVYVNSQNGMVLWNFIPRVGFVPDQRMKTYTDGRLEGSPTCTIPHADHVWYQQPWGATKLYRAKRSSKVRDKPGGAPLPGVLAKDHWVSTNCHQLRGRKEWVSIDFAGRTGFIQAGRLRFWQPGLPAGLPACHTSPTTFRKWIALGDSYASGTGARDYYPERSDDEDDACWRSRNSYWGILHDQLKHGLFAALADFRACHGATTETVRESQIPPRDKAIRLVTISIGGNDMGFAPVLRHCYKPLGTTCEEAIDDAFTQAHLRTLRANLRATYSKIRRAAPKATVLVLGYPELTPRDHVDRCGAIDDNDIPRLRRAARQLNGSIKSAIGKRRGFRFVGLVQTFLEHPACNRGVADWINAGTDPIEESFHPNRLGHEAIANRLRGAAKRWFKQA